MVFAEWSTCNGMAHKFARSDPMENLWNILCRAVYADGKQYNNVGELRTSIISAWDNVNVYVLQKFVNIMCVRVFKVVVKQGSFTGY